MAQGRGEGAGDVSSLTAAVAEAAQDLGRWRRPLSLRVPARAHSHVHTHTRAPSPGVLAGPLGPGSSVACCSLLCRTTVGPNRWWPEAPGPALTQGHSRPSPGHRPCNGGSVPSAPDPLCGSVTGLDPSGSPPPASPGCSRAPAVRARCAVNPQRGRGGWQRAACLFVRPSAWGFCPCPRSGARPAGLHKQPESHTTPSRSKKRACCSRHAAGRARRSPRMLSPLCHRAVTAPRLPAEQFVISTWAARRRHLPGGGFGGCLPSRSPGVPTKCQVPAAPWPCRG